MSRLGSVAVFVSALALGACGKGDSKDGKGGGGGGGGATVDVTAVNAAVPADLKDKLVFESGKVITREKRGTGYTLAIPKGWKKGFTEGYLEPSDANGMGGSPTLGKTMLRVGSNCDGTCEKKDWAAVSDKAEFSQFTDGSIKGTVKKDEKRPNGRTLVFERENPTKDDVAAYVHVAWWEPDASKYHSCSADLGLPLKGAVEAFEKACSKVTGDD